MGLRPRRSNFFLVRTMRAAVVALLGLGSAAASSSASPSGGGTLIVCVEEARELADMDASEKTFSDGSDAFVAVFSAAGQTQSTTEQFDLTSPVPDNDHPIWNECFQLRGTFTSDSEISFVVVDADGPGNTDDVIGTACTTAGTDQRWL